MLSGISTTLSKGRANLVWNARCREAAAASRRRFIQAGARDGSSTCMIPMNLFCPESPFNATQRPAKEPFTRIPVWLIMEAEHTGSILEAGCQALAATLQLPCYLIVRSRHMSQEVCRVIWRSHCLIHGPSSLLAASDNMHGERFRQGKT